MLTGVITYKNNGKIYRYNVVGVDNSMALNLKIESGSWDATNFLEGETLDFTPDTLFNRQITINLSKVVVQRQVVLNKQTGKKMKAGVNTDFFCSLASTIRYMKHNCIKKNQEGYLGIGLASGEFEPEATTTYRIPYEIGEGYFGTVTLHLGDLYGMHIKTPIWEIDLDEDAGIPLELFPAVKDGWSSGIAFNEDYLGFEIKKQEVKEIDSNMGMYTCIEDIVAAHPDKEFEWLLGKDYRIVSDDNLEEVCNYILNYDGYVYYDTETTGLNITFKSRLGADQGDQLVGVVLSVKFGESFYFPLQMESIPNLCGGDHWYVMEHYMRPILEGKKLVAHNMSFDWKVAYIYDINCNIVHDTMALIKLTLGAERKNYPMGLKENTRLLLGRDSLELSDLVIDNTWGQSDITFKDLPYELVRLYACADTDNTNGLLQYAIQADLLAKYNAKKIYEIEIAFSYAVAYQEFYGHKINLDNLSTLRVDIQKGLDENLKKMEEICGHAFNPNSPKELINIMYTELGIPEQISRKTGRVTTDKETVKYLAELTDAEDNIKYPFCDYLLKYRTYEGVRKIIDKFPEHMTEDGYIFSSVMQYGTTTGRVSVNNPNYQSYNDPIKKNVVPRPGYWMSDSDYSSVEYRTLGSMVGNERIMKSFEDPDFDYHQYQAARMYGVPYSAVNKKMRKAAKGINFGLPYGMGDQSLGVRVFGEESPENTRKAAALRNAYFKGQEDIRDWFEFHRNRGVNEGFTETYFGRRRYYHKQDFSVNAIRRQAGNQVIQGCIRGDSLIHDKVAGTVKIKELAGYTAEVWDGEDWTTGDVLYSGKKQKCIVKFKGGYEMVCSPQHKFLVRSHKGNDRFVACQDLIPLNDKGRVRKNAHRVVVCQDYIPSMSAYKSNRIYDSSVGNANNVYLDDIGNSYDMGRFLGRLSSDGSLDVSSGRIRHIIAEHELDVYEYLDKISQPLNCHSKINDVREDRNEAIANVIIYSSSLAKEIDSLDIRHRIDPRIWTDTEMLRGFLCGLFDGDGGVSGKTITFVQGTQEDFEPFVKEVQKALLFFGIRSRYRKYDDRHVLQIKTTDNDRFMEVIGFINNDKTNKALELECKEDEHIFGRCLIVESVEITDELIDMYDVCNTEKGYYVADGIITHNTAADIYKTAVGRLFKRICKEGWLGKVLLTGFIHDEVLCEISNDINPMVWLKVLREEFEVKIDGWCPLYMGYGFGTSWYEAKSVELPIKLQWEFVEKYGETGYPDWDGDGRKFCDTIPDKLRDFSIRDIRNQLTDPENQGKEIKPALNNALLDIVKEDSKIYPDAISEYMQDDFNEVNDIGEQAYLSNVEMPICKWLDTNYHIQSLMKDSEGNYILEFKPAKTTQEAIDQFCAIHGVDRNTVNILDIPEVNEGSVASGDVNLEYYGEEDESVDNKLRLRDTKIDTLGFYLDTDENKIYFQLMPQNYMALIQQKCNKEGKGYRVHFKDNNSKTMYETKAYLPSEEMRFAIDVCIHYMNSK